MDTACKSVTFAAEIHTWLDSHRLPFETFIGIKKLLCTIVIYGV